MKDKNRASINEYLIIVLLTLFVVLRLIQALV